MTAKLRFRDDHTFTIVQFTDVHHWSGDEADHKSTALMEQILDAERPDLVAFTGDVIEASGCANPCESYRQAVAPVNARKVPWAAVFGNHDAEVKVTREELMQVQQESPYCLSVSGPEAVTGVGNYVIQLQSSRSDEPAAALYFLDSGSFAPERIGGYAWIQRSQIDWYVRESQALTARNGSPMPALAFFHIPLPEYNDVYDFETTYGTRLESICCPKLNSGFFHAMVEMGDVMGVFVGHDHSNDFCGDLQGIRLCYGRKTGYNNYAGPDFLHGARVIRLREDVRGFESWLRLEDGSVLRDLTAHTPVGRLLPA